MNLIRTTLHVVGLTEGRGFRKSRIKSYCQKLPLNLFLSLLLFGNVIPISSCVELDENGYYDIVIAVNEKTVVDGTETAVAYLENLKAGIQDMGDALFESTKRKFAIRSADIILPRHWPIDEDAYVTTQYYDLADIRISHEYLAPQAINPIACSYPGNHIELPSSFFSEKDTGPYGPTGKALLTLWARYRWGVHEEHGFSGDYQFPYYWRKMRLPIDDPSLEEEWRVSSCTNQPLTGSFLDDKRGKCDPDHDDELYPPPSECRFYPEFEGQPATTSLMSFQFVKSLKDFCDETNHDVRAPTRQNFYCQFKSVWEVIRLSPDWNKLEENSTTERTRIQFKVVKESLKPLLFVLTDGVNLPPPEVINRVGGGLDSIFSHNANWNVLAGIGVFPGVDWKDSFDTVYTWDFPWYDRTKFISALNSSFESRNGFKAFASAIQDIGNHIRAMGSNRAEQGAVVLIIKYGTEAYDNTYFLQTFESDVLATILDQKIQVFALEGKDNDALTSYRLKDLVNMTGGLHFEIVENDDAGNVAGVDEVMAAINDSLIKGITERQRYVVRKEIFKIPGGYGEPIPFYFQHNEVKNIRFYAHQVGSEYNFYTMSVSFVSGPEPVPPTFEPYDNWGKSETMKSFVAKVDQVFEEVE